jgi:hypothetical protein
LIRSGCDYRIKKEHTFVFETMEHTHIQMAKLTLPTDPLPLMRATISGCKTCMAQTA